MKVQDSSICQRNKITVQKEFDCLGAAVYVCFGVWKVSAYNIYAFMKKNKYISISISYLVPITQTLGSLGLVDWETRCCVLLLNQFYSQSL